MSQERGSRFFRHLFDAERPETPGDAVFFKIFELFVVIASMQLAWSWGFYIPRISDVVLPLGIANYVGLDFMFNSQAPVINAVLISGLVLAGFVRVWRYAYIVAFALLHLQYAARYSLGEIPHSSNLLGMTLLGLGLAMLLYSDDDHRRRFTLGYTYFFVGVGYTLAGVSKLVGTGILWPDGRHLWIWVHEKSIDQFAKSGILELNGLQELILSSHIVATAFLCAGLLTELTSFLVCWRRFRVPIMLAILGMHAGIYIVMNIIFTLTTYELVLLALPWPVWLNAAIERVSWLRRFQKMPVSR